MAKSADDFEADAVLLGGRSLARVALIEIGQIDDIAGALLHLFGQTCDTKLHFVDSGLLASLLALPPEKIALSEVCADDLKLGVVLYDGTRVVPVGDRIFAAPISCLWS